MAERLFGKINCKLQQDKEKSLKPLRFQGLVARCTKKDILLFCVIEGIFSFINQESR